MHLRHRGCRHDEPGSRLIGTAPPSGSAGGGRRAWLSSTLVLLTAVSLLQDAASELLYPLLPVFLTGVLAVPPVVLGVVEGVADATAGVVRYVSGRWSDRRGRRPFISAGYGLAAVGKALVAGAAGWPMVLVGRVSDRFGKGMRSAPRDALIAAATPVGSLGKAYGFHRMGDSLGAVIGPLLGLIALAALDGDVRAAMWWAVIPALLSLSLTFFVRDVPRVVAEVRPDPGAASADTDHTSPLSPEFRRVVTVLAVISLVNFSDALILLRVLDLGMSTTEVVAAYVVFNAVYTMASYPAGALSDRWPRHRVYAGGLVAFAVAYLGLGLTDRGWTVYVLVAVYGFFPALTDGVGKAWIASLVDRQHLGRAQGVYQGLNNMAVLVAGVWAGITWNLGPGDGQLPLMVSGVVGILAAVVLMSPWFARRANAR